METNAVDQWLFAKLTADSLLTDVVSTAIYNTRRPVEGPLPCVLFQLQAPSNDLVLLGAVRVWGTGLWLVRGIAEQASFEGVLATVADRIDAVLHGQSGSNGAGVIHTCVRERPFRDVEVADGREYRHLGGLYRIQAR